MPFRPKQKLKLRLNKNAGMAINENSSGGSKFAAAALKHKAVAAMYMPHLVYKIQLWPYFKHFSCCPKQKIVVSAQK